MPLTADLLAGLRDLLGDRLRTDDAALAAWSHDASIVERQPAAVAIVKSREEVSQAVRWAHETGTPVVTRGGGTSLTGAAVPGVPEVLVLDLSGLDRIVAIDGQDLVADVEAGVVTADLARAAEAQGLLYAPDPASLETSTIGGNLATNAGGARGLKYGTTRHQVLGLEVVLADGSVLQTGSRTAKNATGYGLAHLFVGSEGTLGVITRALLRLIPRPPAERTVMAAFATPEAAAALVGRILAAGILPASAELMDGFCLRSVERLAPSGLPQGAEALLLLRLDGTELAATEAQEVVAELCRGSGATEVRLPRDRTEDERLWAARRSVTGALEQVGPAKLGEDVVVPRGQVAAMLHRVAAVAERHGLPIAVFGHIGDGNLHPNILFDPARPDEVARMRAAAGELCQAALDLGGLPSGEHGIGELKKDLLPLALDPAALDLMRALKSKLDPAGILNPSKVFPDGRSLIQPPPDARPAASLFGPLPDP
ncbi:MAG TPA: FAD-linked oxidase C-terminal domain-containing protein [Candidatus Limnocylindrales bacterium]|nr:FAD-linked oxidase C-terminal domain-containing protein [Candidatus Limnocylindrales bacterium]